LKGSSCDQKNVSSRKRGLWLENLILSHTNINLAHLQQTKKEQARHKLI